MAKTVASIADLSLKEQYEEFARVLKASEDAGVAPTSFFKKMHNLAKERLEKNDDTPLVEGQVGAIQVQERRLQAALENSGGSLFEKSAVEKESTVEYERAVMYVPGTVVDDTVTFARGDYHGLTWIDNPGLPDGVYIFEVKQNEGDSAPTITNARLTLMEETVTFHEQKGEASSVFVRPFATQYESISYPIRDPLFEVDEKYEAFFDIIIAESQNLPQNVMLLGPQGTGKTELVAQIAAKHGYGFLSMSCGSIESPGEWFGHRSTTVNTNGDVEVTYVPSAFIEAISRPRTIILLDEFNRLHSSLTNPLYNILDRRGSAWIDYLKQSVRVASGVVFVATCNIGTQHTGTFAIDAAMEDRFPFMLQTDYMPEEREIMVLQKKMGISHAVAKQLVRVANSIRQDAKGDESIISKPLSFRQLEATALLIKRGMTPREAVEFTILPKYDDTGETESEQAAVLQIIQGIFL